MMHNAWGESLRDDLSSSLFFHQGNPALTPTRASAVQLTSVPLLTHCGNPQKESPSRPSSSEGAGLKVTQEPSAWLLARLLGGVPKVKSDLCVLLT